MEFASGEEAEDAVEVARLTFEAVLIRVLQRVYYLKNASLYFMWEMWVSI